MFEYFTFNALGTRWEVETLKVVPDEVRAQIARSIDAFETVYSRFKDDSLVSRVASALQGGRFTFPENALVLFELYDRLHAVTEGAVDPLVGRRLERLGYDKTYSLGRAVEHCLDDCQAERDLVWRRDITRDGVIVTTERPVLIDVGAAGKGLLVDSVSILLRDAGFDTFMVNASGDMRHCGEQAIRVGLEHPSAPDRVIGVANLEGRALCASAVNRRAWGDGLHHVLDARTGHPVRGVTATWVIADDAATADGLATALFFVSSEPLAEQFDFTYVRMFADGRAEASPDFDGELFFAMD